MKIHIVKQGDTLYELAQKYHVELDTLIAANPQIADPNVLTVGEKVKIPNAPKPLNPPSDYLYKHTVVQGDTLWKLGKAWGVPLPDMVAANPQLKNPNILMTGDVVYIPKMKQNPNQNTNPNSNQNTNPMPKADTSVMPLAEAAENPVSPEENVTAPAENWTAPAEEQPNMNQPNMNYPNMWQEPAMQQPVMQEPNLQPAPTVMPEAVKPVLEKPVSEKPNWSSPMPFPNNAPPLPQWHAAEQTMPLTQHPYIPFEMPAAPVSTAPWEKEKGMDAFATPELPPLPQWTEPVHAQGWNQPAPYPVLPAATAPVSTGGGCGCGTPSVWPSAAGAMPFSAAPNMADPFAGAQPYPLFGMAQPMQPMHHTMQPMQAVQPFGMGPAFHQPHHPWEPMMGVHASPCPPVTYVTSPMSMPCSPFGPMHAGDDCQCGCKDREQQALEEAAGLARTSEAAPTEAPVAPKAAAKRKKKANPVRAAVSQLAERSRRSKPAAKRSSYGKSPWLGR